MCLGGARPRLLRRRGAPRRRPPWGRRGAERAVPGKCGPPVHHRPPLSVPGCAARLAAADAEEFRVLCLRVRGLRIWEVNGSLVRRGPHHGLVPLCVPGWQPSKFNIARATRQQSQLGGVFSPAPLDVRAAGGGGVPGLRGSPAALVAGAAAGGGRGRVALRAPPRNSPGCRLPGKPRGPFGLGRAGVLGRWVRSEGCGGLDFSVLVSVAVRAPVPRAAGARRAQRYLPWRARGRHGPSRARFGAYGPVGGPLPCMSWRAGC